MLTAAALASDTRLVANGNGSGAAWDIKGDPTEGALIVAAAKASLQKAALDSANPRVHEIPFSSETKRMTTLHQTPSGVVAYAKGAPEVILSGCDSVLTSKGMIPLDATERNSILLQAQMMLGL